MQQVLHTARDSGHGTPAALALRPLRHV